MEGGFSRSSTCTAVGSGPSSVIIAFIYAAAALGIGIYMVAALLRPDKF